MNAPVHRVVVADRTGEPAEVLRVEERPTPRPGPGQVAIRVHAAPIHASDLHIIRGRYGFAPEFPAVLGLESVGVVEALGAGVENVEVGQRVVTVGVSGTWQEVLVADADRVLAVPAGLSDSTACQVVINPLTAWVLVTEELDVQPGEWLLQTAAGSTVGKLILALARARGFKTLNVVRRRDAVAEVRELGGDEVICTEDEDLGERISEITGPDGGVVKAIDCVAGQVGADVSRALAPDGELVVYGALSTHRQTDPSALTIPLFARSMIYETKTVRGFWLFRWFTANQPARIAEALGHVRDLVVDETMTIPEGQRFAPENCADAVQLAEAPAHGGKPLFDFRRTR